jgi:magnesium transporter
MKYNSATLLEESVERVEDLLSYRDETATLWVHVVGLGDAEVIQELGDVFGLHRLALEDVVHVHQRAKVEEYEDHLFIVVRMVSMQGDLRSEQMSLFLGRNFVLTFVEEPGDCLEPVRDRLRKSRGRLRDAKADYLAYSIIDAVVDAYFPVVDHYGDLLESLDELVIAGRSPPVVRSLHEIRGDLMVLRHAIRPLRDALVTLMPDPHSLIAAETQIYFRDCYDHTVQLIDLLDTYRDLCSDLRDFFLSMVSNRMNEVMKFLTIISTIFIPLGFIAGVYGMNFNTRLAGNMPELNWPYGYVLVLTLMAAVAGGLLIVFWRKGWLGRDNQ